jgi:hypothetical protein
LFLLLCDALEGHSFSVSVRGLADDRTTMDVKLPRTSPMLHFADAKLCEARRTFDKGNSLSEMGMEPRKCLCEHIRRMKYIWNYTDGRSSNVVFHKRRANVFACLTPNRHHESFGSSSPPPPPMMMRSVGEWFILHSFPSSTFNDRSERPSSKARALRPRILFVCVTHRETNRVHLPHQHNKSCVSYYT